MFIVLPYSKGGLQDLINNLNVQVLRRSINAMETYIVELTLPKFKFDFQSRFAQFLKEVSFMDRNKYTYSPPWRLG